MKKRKKKKNVFILIHFHCVLTILFVQTKFYACDLSEVIDQESRRAQTLCLSAYEFQMAPN